MKRTLALFTLAAATACGAPRGEAPAAVGLAVTIDAASQARMRYAAEVTDPDAVLKEFTPTRLQVMVCDNISLTNVVTNFCTAEAGDYNFIDVIDIAESTGTLALSDVPPGKDQVIVVQGLAGSSQLLTYQGFVSAPAIAPRGSYQFDVSLSQIRYPPLTPADPPVLVTPSPSEVTHDTTTFTIRGTRELETLLRVTLDGKFRIGSPKTFTASEGGYYVEREKGGKLEWELTLSIPEPRTTTQTYAITFQAARVFDESNFSKETRFLLKACGQADAGTCPTP